MASNKQNVNQFLFRTFQRLDADKNGTITKYELKRVLMSGGCASEQLLDQKLQEMDLDNDGNVNFWGNCNLFSFEYWLTFLLIEFCYAYIESVIDKDYNQKLQALFSKYDSDNDQSISTDELQLLLTEVFQNDPDIEKQIPDFDADNDGQINYQGKHSKMNFFVTWEEKLFTILTFVAEFLMLVFKVGDGFRKLRGFWTT